MIKALESPRLSDVSQGVDQYYTRRSKPGRLLMSADDGDKVWEKLETIEKRGTDMLIEMSRMGGDQRTAHAEFNGKLNLLTSKMEQLEKQQNHDKANVAQSFTVMDVRLGKLEEKTSYFLGKVAGMSAAISTMIAAVALALKAFGGS